MSININSNIINNNSNNLMKILILMCNNVKIIY